MTKAYLFFGPAVLACASLAQAAEAPLTRPADTKLAQPASGKLALTTEYTNYSGSFGKRQETTAQYSTDLGRTAFTVSASHAKRKFENDSFTAVELSGTIYRDWGDRFYTRTNVALSSDKPVFATRQVSNDFNFKVLPGAVVTVGGKYARYYGDRDALSWSAGGTWYFGGGLATYRYSNYNVDRLGKSHSHLATFRLKDGRGDGQTQLWLGSGTSLHEEELLLSGRKGNYRSIALQRVQPIKGRLAVNVTLGRTWYDTNSANYRGTTASIGLSFNGLPKL